MKLTFLVTLFSLLSLAPTFAEEFVLKLLLWEGYAPEKQVHIFEKLMFKKHGKKIKVEVNNADSVKEMFDKIKNKQVDIISPAHCYAKSEKYQFVQKGFLLPYNLKNMPHFKDMIPALKSSEFVSHQWKVYAMPIAHGPYGLIYNTKYFDVAPNSWSILWDPRLKGKYSISEDQFEANIYITALAMGFDKKDFTNLKKIKTPLFKEKLNDLYHNAGGHWRGVDTVEDLKDKVIATSWGDSRHALKKIGQNWVFAEPKEGVTGWIDSLYLGHSLKDKPFMKLIAEEWVNYSISPEFQIDVMLRDIGNDPVNLSIINKITPKEIKAHHLDDPSYFLNNRINWPELSERNQNWFDHIWKKVLNSKP